MTTERDFGRMEGKLDMIFSAIEETRTEVRAIRSGGCNLAGVHVENVKQLRRDLGEVRSHMASKRGAAGWASIVGAAVASGVVAAFEWIKAKG